MSISIKYVHDMVSFMIDKTHHKKQRRTDIDLATYEASLVVFNEFKEEYERTSTISEYMSAFEAQEKYASITTPNGEFAKPTTYNRYVRISTSDGKKVDVIKNAQWDERANHPIKIADVNNPIARIGNTKIYVLPASVKIHLTYWKNPVAPTYVETPSGDFDASASVNLEWSMDLWPKISNLVLGKLGINLSEAQIIQYSEMQKR